MSADRNRTDRLDRDAVAGRLGLRLGQLLADGSEALPHDVAERLRVAREQALARARLARRQVDGGAVVTAGTAPAMVTAGGSGLVGGGAGGGIGGGAPWWQRLASLAPLLALVLGLFVIERVAVHEQALAAAEFDVVLLADDLPPTAYSDPGFAEFLRNSPP